MMYRNGSVALEKKINSQADAQPDAVLLKIDPELPAIENYLLLNKASGGSRRIAPLSLLAARYVGFSERHLLPLFWHWPTLKDKIRRMMVEDRYFQDPAIVPAQADALNWLTKTTPGRLVTTFLTDVGLPPDKHDKGYRKVTAIMDLDGKNGKGGLREHLGCLWAETFDPRSGTAGVLAFKLKELQSVRYRRVPENKLPNPFVTTIGGTNRYLTEARNVFSTSAAVESLLAADPSQVGVLPLDLGTSCLVGATVSLPPGQTPAILKRPLGEEGDQKKKKTRRAKRKPSDRKDQRKRQKARKLTKQTQTTQYFDMVVKRKAVSRPTDSFANWLEERKENSIGASTGRTIQDIETDLPLLKGEGASFRKYVAARRASEEDLNNFYNNTNFWKHGWDAEVCRKEEFYKVTNGLLNMIGGSVGRPRLPHQHVAIAIGLAKFTAVQGPPALNSTFEAFFVNLARSLDYLVLGINEHYSSKKCPVCHGFVCATSNWRTLYCKTRKCFRQRYVMASANMNNAIKAHLIHQQRPLYLQPQRQDGSYPWMNVAADSGSGGSGGEAGGLSADAIDSIGVGAGGSGGGGAAAASPSIAAATNSGGLTSKRRAASIVSVEVSNTDVNPTADASSSSSDRTMKKARKEGTQEFHQVAK
ncbi:hypothetical protein BGZ54_000260 [Gamsiella multidivaricata]|nr:hypothetical protein BGZ54_000260 [Gamsiella multidivaricata]